jgi:hypothetical protein
MEKTLVSLGYRMIKPNVWFKPIGFHNLSFEVDKNLWTNWFMGGNGESFIWNSDVYEPDPKVEDDFKKFIQYLESYTKTSHYVYADFSFLTLEDQLNYD